MKTANSIQVLVSAALLAAATYGLGLCAEELRQFDEAEKIYREMISDSNLKGAAAVASAEYRLKTLDHYRSEIVFNEAPEEVNLAPVTIPLDSASLGDVNLVPVTIPLAGTPPIDVNTEIDVNAPALGPVLEPAVAAPLPVVETNTPE